MNLNIPIYRAKKIGGGHVYGFYRRHEMQNKKYRHFMQEDTEYETAMTYEIDPSTISIHFPNMIDSEGNKIFASFDIDNGKGGDIVESSGYDFNISQKTLTFEAPRGLNIKLFGFDGYELKYIKVMGIQQ